MHQCGFFTRINAWKWSLKIWHSCCAESSLFDPAQSIGWFEGERILSVQYVNIATTRKGSLKTEDKRGINVKKVV